MPSHRKRTNPGKIINRVPGAYKDIFRSLKDDSASWDLDRVTSLISHFYSVIPEFGICVSEAKIRSGK